MSWRPTGSLFKPVRPITLSTKWNLHVQRCRRQSSLRTFQDDPQEAPDNVPIRQQLKDQLKQKKAAKKKNSKYDDHDAMGKAWELTVGIEIHAELDTARKLFSSAPTNSGSKPNTNVSLHDLAYPGAQPIFQIGTVLPALRAALALDCTIQRESTFDRKHYFYQDQPAGYQITQFYQPFAKNGTLTLGEADGISRQDGDSVDIGIERVQLEQDTAKSLVVSGDSTLLDFNRVSHPLIEIISRPDIHSPATAAAYVRKVQALLKSVGAVTAGMETGGLRADVNVSVRKRSDLAPEDTRLGQRTEIKNLSSLKAVEDAVKAERDRQIAILESGGTIEGETRGWTVGGTETYSLRKKEGEVDYRYMPDPDLPPLIISQQLIQQLQATIPLPADTLVAKLVDGYGVTEKDARTLCNMGDGERLEYFFDAVARTEDLLGSTDMTARVGRLIANFTVHEIPALMTKIDLEPQWSPELIPALQLASLVHLLHTKRIHNSAARVLLAKIFETEDGASLSVSELAEKENLLRSLQTDEDSPGTDSTDLIDDVVGPVSAQVFEVNQKMVNDILVKKEVKKVYFFVGLVMKELGKQGKAKTYDPRDVSDAVQRAFWDKYGP
ncbi:hypothetical protein BT63DRAFT_204445 [Microthyrium microscopicum]|uniref:Glutamyl-tRNA(Gln) amidotransferase subunit B, mitochondrial n=1 Tax=Microthyrium microscopicum TaxID=703497 RepID=A0A6A6UJ81_9PEZI|nr:hypothetical protein BT63DRAFT_204445 [Microthyrium microscopicum]